MKKKEKRNKSKLPKKSYLDKMWREIIILRANMKSELSGKYKGTITLGAHHVYGKSTLALRYDIRNGICLDNSSEHIFGVHNKADPVRANEIYNQIAKVIKKREGENIFNEFQILKYVTKKNIYLIEFELKETLRLLKEKANE